jgi:superfamily II DNA or RNA helicase
VTVLRAFQADVKQRTYDAWDAGHDVVMGVVPTGGGKTVIKGSIAKDHYDEPGITIAHRSELVGQVSVALAREEVPHNIIGSRETVKKIVDIHMREFGRSWFNPRANWHAASIDTLIRRDIEDRVFKRLRYGFIDEGHHALRDNKWGTGVAMCPPDMKWFLPTATPIRADGRGLGSHADGIVDVMVEGPDMRWMIDNGYLTRSVIRGVRPSDLNLDDVAIGETGDFNKDSLRKAVKRSNKIIGDIVGKYVECTPGLTAICFAVDVEHGTQIAQGFNDRGIPAQVVSDKTPATLRDQYLRQLEAGTLKVLVNVDLFGEGFDLPAIQVCIFARPTASYALYCQQYGRVLRLQITREQARNWDSYTVAQRLAIIAASVKPYAHIHDHVGNVIMHKGPPERRQFAWSLDAREKRTRATDGVSSRLCLNPVCMETYEKFYTACPYCNVPPLPPLQRNRPELLDGDLSLYDEELMDALFGAIAKVDGNVPYMPGASNVVKNSVAKNHRERKDTQMILRETIAVWAGYHQNFDTRTRYRKFYADFGVDVLTAQAMGVQDAHNLIMKIKEVLP